MYQKISAIKNWFDSKSVEDSQTYTLSEAISNAKQYIISEEVTLLRGNMSRLEYEKKKSEIIKNHYSNLKLTNRLLVSFNNFKTLVESKS